MNIPFVKIPAGWRLFNRNGEARTPYYFYLKMANMGDSEHLSSFGDNVLKVIATHEDG